MKQIKDMFLIRKAMSFILILSLLTVPAFAATNTKSANFSCNSTPPSGFNLFHPTTGSITGTYNSASTTVSTKVNFSYTTAAVSKINAYNTSKKYTGIDIKDVGNSFHAYSVTSTAPNIKTDIETNSGHDYYNEAEIVIFGSLTAGKTYSMTASWTDYRKGFLSHVFRVHAELSEKGVSDYNVIAGGYKQLADLSYGKTAGYP